MQIALLLLLLQLQLFTGLDRWEQLVKKTDFWIVFSFIIHQLINWSHFRKTAQNSNSIFLVKSVDFFFLSWSLSDRTWNSILREKKVGKVLKETLSVSRQGLCKVHLVKALISSRFATRDLNSQGSREASKQQRTNQVERTKEGTKRRKIEKLFIHFLLPKTLQTKKIRKYVRKLDVA